MNKTALAVALSLVFLSQNAASNTIISNKIDSNINMASNSVALTNPASIHDDAMDHKFPIAAPLLALHYEKARSLDWENQEFSEKLDGIRAIWTGHLVIGKGLMGKGLMGKGLVTKNGTPIFAPDWFTRDLPDTPLEGELWGGRGNFEHVMSVVLDDIPDDKEWESIQFMLFDLPAHKGNHAARYQALQDLTLKINKPHIQYIKHWPAKNEAHVKEQLDQWVKEGAEGIILRDKTALYHSGRHQSVLKLKITDDAEAQVLRYIEGKGKYQGKMGSMLVMMGNGKTFKIGSGFTDKQRETPPEIGSHITYRYNGFTQNGIPKFARFWREDRSK